MYADKPKLACLSHPHIPLSPYLRMGNVNCAYAASPQVVCFSPSHLPPCPTFTISHAFSIPYLRMGDVNCTYADSPKLACLWGLEATVLRVMQLRRRCALQGPGGTAASAASLGSTGASWPRYGSGSPSLAPAAGKGARCA